MDRDELREKIKAIIAEAQEEDHHGNLLMYSDEATDSILSLPALREALEKAEKWDRVEDTHEFKFVRHIESHLSGNQVPICTICGKTIFEIALEGKEG